MSFEIYAVENNTLWETLEKHPAEEVLRMLERNPFGPLTRTYIDERDNFVPFDHEQVLSELTKPIGTEGLVGMTFGSGEIRCSLSLCRIQNVVQIAIDSEDLPKLGDLEKVKKYLEDWRFVLPAFLFSGAGADDRDNDFWIDVAQIPPAPACVGSTLNWYSVMSPLGYQYYVKREALLATPGLKVEELSDGTITILAYEHPLDFATPETTKRIGEITNYLNEVRHDSPGSTFAEFAEDEPAKTGPQGDETTYFMLRALAKPTAAWALEERQAEEILQMVEQNPFGPITTTYINKRQFEFFNHEKVLSKLKKPISDEGETLAILGSGDSELERLLGVLFPIDCIIQRTALGPLVNVGIQTEDVHKIADLEEVKKYLKDWRFVPAFLFSTADADYRDRDFWFDFIGTPPFPTCFGHRLGWYNVISPLWYKDYCKREDMLAAPALRVEALIDGTITILAFEHPLDFATEENTKRMIEMTNYFNSVRLDWK